MTVRLPQIFRGRAPSARGSACSSCGEEISADGHAIRRASGAYHAACVLYGPRAHPPGATRLRATR